jgi:hypothetical protein
MSLPIAQLGMGMYQQLANYHPYCLSILFEAQRWEL